MTASTRATGVRVGRRDYAVALLLGAAAVLAFAPAGLALAGVGALGGLVHLWLRAARSREAFALGYAFGLGFFLAGVSWVYVSMNLFGGMTPVLAAVATLGFCAFLALFPAAAGWLQAQVPGAPLSRAALAIPPAWMLMEWLRGWVLTGFPWLGFGYATADTWLAGFAPLVGAHGASLLFLVVAGLAACAARGDRRRLCLGVLVALLAGGHALRQVDWTTPTGTVTVSLLQGNIPQEMKFRPERYARTLETYAQLAEGAKARLVVLPETAVPRFLDLVDPAWLARLEAVARANGGDVLLGIPVRTGPDTYLNSVVSLGTSPPQRYDKSHLVPFGEFIPPGFGWIMRGLSIPLSDFARGPATQAPLAVAGERVALSICYENAYGEELARQLPQATLLVNVSNVAWFGDSLAPAQHLGIARLRALETGRMHLTATNTGITAAIDRDGRVLAQLPQFTLGRLNVTAVRYEGATPYVRWGDLGALGLAAVLLAVAALLARAGGRR